MSGRYTNYHPIAIHTANLYSSQTCLNETDDCGGNQMHCRAIVYHPAAVYIPHAHTPTFHNASGGSSLLPTPATVSQQIYDSTGKAQCFGSRDYAKSGSTNGQHSYAKSQSHGIALSSHQGPYVRAQSIGNAQSYKHTNIDTGYKYSPAMTSRFSVQYNKKTTPAAGTNVGSPACYLAQKSSDNYGASQGGQKSGPYALNATGQSYNCSQRMFNPSQSFDYANAARRGNSRSNSAADGYSRKHGANSYRNNGTAVHADNGPSNQSSNDNHASNPDAESNGPQVTENVNAEKPVSPPPAPYSPMTRPLPTLSPPNSQVQFYAPAQNRYQPSLAPSQHQQQSANTGQRRYTIPPALSTARKPSTEKYTGGNQATMLRQSKYKVNGIMQTGVKVTDDSLGGAGDAPPGIGRMPITPPGTPRSHSAHPAGDQNQLSDTCHQMQALSL